MVRFATGSGPWAVAVEHAVEVRPATAVRALPSAAPAVAGVIERDGAPIPVVRTLGDDGRHVLVVRTIGGAGRVVGLLVEEVTGVVHVADDAIGPPPAGQHDPLVGATVRHGGDLTFLVDVDELARSLGGQP